ncbi:MAG: glycoside hydrolase, partial [Pyrinomonadaceae bacterium]
GHGNAISQAYNHTVLPLCNERDRRTQIRWGLADFVHRFGREPEAMWLPETACNDHVLGLLIDERLRFVILAPQQAARVRTGTRGIPACHTHADSQSSEPEANGWQSVSANSIAPIDTSVPYRYFHRDGSGRSIAVFFYDQELARGIA